MTFKDDIMVDCPGMEEGFRKPGLHCATAGEDGGMCPHVDMVHYDRETDRALIKCLWPALREKP